MIKTPGRDGLFDHCQSLLDQARAKMGVKTLFKPIAMLREAERLSNDLDYAENRNIYLRAEILSVYGCFLRRENDTNGALDLFRRAATVVDDVNEDSGRVLCLSASIQLNSASSYLDSLLPPSAYSSALLGLSSAYKSALLCLTMLAPSHTFALSSHTAYARGGQQSETQSQSQLQAGVSTGNAKTSFAHLQCTSDTRLDSMRKRSITTLMSVSESEEDCSFASALSSLCVSYIGQVAFDPLRHPSPEQSDAIKYGREAMTLVCGLLHVVGKAAKEEKKIRNSPHLHQVCNGDRRKVDEKRRESPAHCTS